MEKIKEILRLHDIAGIVVLQSETHAEWLNHLSPSWSAARMFKDERGEGIHVKALAKDYPSPEAHQHALEVTSGMLCGFREGALKISSNMETVLAMLTEKLGGIDHISREAPPPPRRFTP